MAGVAQQAVMAARLVRANFQRLATPVKVNLCVTYWCQYRCKTCNIWTRQPTGELTTDELLAFVGRNRGIQWLDVTGGEIFLRKDIEDVFDGIAGGWPGLVIFHFATNGFLTDRIVAATSRLASRTRARVIVTVSVDGDQRLNDEVRGIRGGFARQLATLRALRRVPGVEAVVGMTLSKHNVDRIDETFCACRRECPDLRIEEFHVNVAQRSSHYYGNHTNDMDASADATRAALAAYRRMRPLPRTPSAWLESQYLEHLDRFLATRRTPMPCHALRSSCFISPTGDVFPCITDERTLGNLRDTDMRLEPIWAGRRAAGLQSAIWQGRCPQCWTACEAYPSILGNLARPVVWHQPHVEHVPARSS
jgi:radical SAM protein with 4Fe4S-binding SPASM domain